MLRILSVRILCFMMLGAYIALPEKQVYPDKLSAWGIFEGNISLLKPAPGFVPYALNTPLFSDYAEKSRLIRLPKGSSVNYATEGVLDFPTGTLLVKTFYYSADFRHPGINKHIVETRLLVKEPDGWNALTYIWNDAQTDAEREIAGDEQQVNFIDQTGAAKQVRYVVPNQNQCKGCHNVNDRLMPIGPSVARLNGNYVYASGNKNQLDYWQLHGMLRNVPSHSAIPRAAVWNDPATGNLDARARAYLDINCGHCHRREGPAQTSGLFLRASETNPTMIGINKTPVAAGKGSGGRMVDIKPGDANASILWYRMQTHAPGERMPELGRTTVHDEGVALIREWINHM